MAGRALLDCSGLALIGAKLAGSQGSGSLCGSGVALGELISSAANLLFFPQKC